MMTRKHFKAFAEALKAITNEKERTEAAKIIAGVCKRDNPNFKFDRFYAAAGVKG